MHLLYKCFQTKKSTAFCDLKSLTSDINIYIIYYALVQSRIRYSFCSWEEVAIITSKKRFFFSQKRAIRTITRISQQEACQGHFRKSEIIAVLRIYIFVILNNLAKWAREEKGKHKTARLTNSNSKYELVKHESYYQVRKLFIKLPDNIQRPTVPTAKILNVNYKN